jgi:Fe-S cluster assembly protein SufD
LSADALKARFAAQPAFLTERRLLALDHYLKAPMPGKKDEVWRRVEWSGFNPDAAALKLADGQPSVLSALPAEDSAKGVLWTSPENAAKERPELLKRYWNTEVFPAGVEDRHGSGGKFHSLNEALWNGGYVLHVLKGVEVSTPLWSRAKNKADAMIAPHGLIVVEDGATATVIEEYTSENGANGLVNPQTEIILGKNAKLLYILLQDVGPESVYIGAHRARQYGDSKLTFVSAHLGGKLAKAFIATQMLESYAHAYLSGVYYGTKAQRIHMDTYQHHIAPNCTTDLMFKGALDDNSRAVYRGMIRLEEGAQKTDSYQQNRTLLMKDSARIDSIPGLEILANDVRCTHGSTAGQIDPTMLFYLMSRGLTQFQATKMIMDGFFEEVVLRFGLQEVIEPLRKQIDAKIGYGG